MSRPWRRDGLSWEQTRAPRKDCGVAGSLSLGWQLLRRPLLGSSRAPEQSRLQWAEMPQPVPASQELGDGGPVSGLGTLCPIAGSGAGLGRRCRLGEERGVAVLCQLRGLFKTETFQLLVKHHEMLWSLVSRQRFWAGEGRKSPIRPFHIVHALLLPPGLTVSQVVGLCDGLGWGGYSGEG